MTTWLKDNNGNKCSVEYFGSTKDAQAALDSLRNCKSCVNCSDCSRCYGCSCCSGCYGCSCCSGCYGCSCCSGCSGCSDCSDCSGCSGCYGCSCCSHVAWLNNKQNVQANPDKASTPLGPPPVPVIENIHQRIYEAASNPTALKMDTWHTCEKTHCRAGWVVTLAGEAGKALERFYDTPLAALKIYDASSTLERVNPPRFFEDNETAMADMKRMAELEAKSSK